MPKSKSTSTFTQQFAELEAIIKKFESEEWNIDEGLVEFERALELAKQLKKTIRTAENTVEQLKNKYSEEEE
ncbi:MAG: exodeoxyribonuclease VII small subunit [Candidatus Kerfeldbacteria bacterium]|nr:exodeoxyribonuclease VII small subunit [Candidatus Kerfeldbacteria bacterium]